jgi:RNA 3'-terminal phosphate cyclase (ATP)
MVRPGEYRFAVGTAGSGTLVFQTVLPALMLASGPSKVVIEGGTHNHAAPPYHFLARTFLPLVERIGPKFQLQFDRYGFYPAGGGRFSVEIQPAKTLSPLEIRARGEITSRRAIAIVANLPRHICAARSRDRGRHADLGTRIAHHRDDA